MLTTARHGLTPGRPCAISGASYPKERQTIERGVSKNVERAGNEPRRLCPEGFSPLKLRTPLGVGGSFRDPQVSVEAALTQPVLTAAARCAL
jgi:hypothetical protein